MPAVTGFVRSDREARNRVNVFHFSKEYILTMIHGDGVKVLLALCKNTKKLIFSAIRFDRYKVLFPIDASIAVVQGAVMFGQKPHIIDSRVMSTTYGFDTYHHFDPSIHPVEKRCVIEGTALCKDCFVKLVREGEIVKVGQTKRFPNYEPLRKDQTSVTFNFYTSTDPDARYVTDAAVGPSIGRVTVQSPNISFGSNRKIDACVYFGGTEIKATAIDKTSGNTATAYLDFLCKR